MIINKGYAQNDVVTMKLTSGEELIARYMEETDTTYVITKPVSLVPTPQGSLGMVPALFSAELTTGSKINLQKSAVSMHTHCRKDVADEYTRGTSGIKPANSLDGLLNIKNS